MVQYYKIKKTYNAIMLCLRPAVLENLSTSCSGGSPFKHLQMESMDGRLSQSSASEKDAPASGHYKKKSTRKFVRLIKAVLFETSLANKIKKRSRKKKQCSNGDSPISKVDIQKDKYPITAATSNSKFGKKDQGSRYIASCTPSIETSSSTYSSSSCASSIASSSARFQDSDLTSTRMDQKQKQALNNGKENNIGRVYYGFNTGLCLVLVALLVLVLWGKLFAILCTSAWLFFVPNWRIGMNTIKRFLWRDYSRS